MIIRALRNLAMGISCLTITGCGGCGGGATVPPPPVANTPVPAPPATTKNEELVRMVADTKSDAALKILMTNNGLKVPNAFDLKSIVSWGEGPADAVGVVTKPELIKSQGKNYLVASLVDKEGGPYIEHNGRIVVFQVDGTVLKEFGQGGSEAKYGDSAEVVSLGTNDTWFVHVTHKESKPPFNELSDYYLIAENCPHLVRVWHGDSAVGFSRTPSEAKQFGESFLLFFDPKNTQATGGNGIDPDGKEQAPRLRWDPKERVFRGPVAIRQRTTPLYEVVVEESHGFKATNAK